MTSPRDPHSYSHNQIEHLARAFRRARVQELCGVSFIQYLTDPVRYDAAAARLGRRHRVVARIVLDQFPPSNN